MTTPSAGIRGPRTRSHDRIPCDPSAAAVVVSETCSRVYPSRSPPPPLTPPPLIPSCGSRRMTRAALSKLTDRDARALARVTRLAAPRSLDGGERRRRSNAASVEVDEGKKRVSGLGVQRHEPKEGSDSLSADILAITNRGQQPILRLDDLPLDASFSRDRRYGFVYIRKRHRKKPDLVLDGYLEDGNRERGLEIGESTSCILAASGVSLGDLCTSSDCSMVLAVLVDSSFGGSSDIFMHVLISMMKWVRRARVKLLKFVTFLCSRVLVGVFSLHGIHFLLIRQQSVVKGEIFKNATLGCGVCKIYGAKHCFPLISFDFMCLPSYFKFLHVTMILETRYLISLNTNRSIAATDIVEATEPDACNAIYVARPKLLKHPKKRRSLRKPIRVKFYDSCLCSKRGYKKEHSNSSKKWQINAHPDVGPRKIIPIPGVREVYGYNEIVTTPFVRPVRYIRMMDLQDKKFLRELNFLNCHDLISKDCFLEIIFALEKCACSHPGDFSNKEKALYHCQNLGRRDVVEVVFDYWFEKRAARPNEVLQRRQLRQKPIRLMKRSLTSKPSLIKRGKPSIFLQAFKERENMESDRKTESKANKVGILCRNRAPDVREGRSSKPHGHRGPPNTRV